MGETNERLDGFDYVLAEGQKQNGTTTGTERGCLVLFRGEGRPLDNCGEPEEGEGDGVPAHEGDVSELGPGFRNTCPQLDIVLDTYNYSIPKRLTIPVSIERRAQTAHIIRESPTEPAWVKIPLGATKIPGRQWKGGKRNYLSRRYSRRCKK